MAKRSTDKTDWIWMGRAAHFICSERCRFHLATYIPRSNVIVSTVGMFFPTPDSKPENIGCDRLFETMVFKAKKSTDPCCPYHIITPEIDFLAANSDKEASENHMELCRKWDTSQEARNAKAKA